MAAYLHAVRVPWVRNAFGLGSEFTHEQIRAHVHRMAVFRLIPRATGPHHLHARGPLEES
ncbi:hypothetical protein AB0L13_40910 [Saccharopolyspora shandongensis]|uniref:hypothetical protein n=1 Tax=Saccharopolyspora shandongensis TaxID=418495 RepID=UPI00341F3C34